jgi:hypothetical protein
MNNGETWNGEIKIIEQLRIENKIMEEKYYIFGNALYTPVDRGNIGMILTLIQLHCPPAPDMFPSA